MGELRWSKENPRWDDSLTSKQRGADGLFVNARREAQSCQTHENTAGGAGYESTHRMRMRTYGGSFRKSSVAPLMAEDEGPGEKRVWQIFPCSRDEDCFARHGTGER